MTEAETPHELVLVNRYDASPEQVRAAWTEPDNFIQWWCPPGWKVSDVVMEVQPRGRFQQTHTSPDGEMVMPFAGFYREVAAPGRLVFTLSDAPSPDDEARTVLTESGNRREACVATAKLAQLRKLLLRQPANLTRGSEYLPECTGGFLSPSGPSD